jgi:peptidoglycan/LPS O-acetylase OafA/YrhL
MLMPATSSKSRPSFIHLDMARSLAALAVLAGHLRSFVFLSYGDLKSHSPLDVVVWAGTGFGHQAVMIFFVLSGFFITRSIVVDDRQAGFSWPVYLIKRLTRLWIVLIPSLCLTLVCDRIGMSISETGFYDGDLFPMYNSGPAVATGGTNLEFFTFLGNLLFLQTILTPIFGSNGPLWSLANEFWYYLMFPLMYLGLTRRVSWSMLLTNFGMLTAIDLFIGQGVALLGLIWLAGAFCYFIHDRGWCRQALTSAPALALALVLLAISLAVSKGGYGTDFAKDCLVGLASALLVLVLAEREGGTALYHKGARLLADGSYTMYLVHFPFMALLANVVLNNRKFDASLLGYSVFFSLGIAVLIYCYLVYWLFERQTATIRRYLLARYRQLTGLAVKGVK